MTTDTKAEMKQSKVEEISVFEFIHISKKWWQYILSKWLIIVAAGAIAACIGFMYAWVKKPLYTAELTFASENESGGNINSYAGIATQFGLNLGGSSSSAFEGENLMHLMSSRRLLEKTLLTSVTINQKNYLLINYYIQVNDLEKKYREIFPKNTSVYFTNTTLPYSRQRDSVLMQISKGLSKSLEIEKIDKKSDIISVKLKNRDELFAKNFVEELVSNVIQYYTDYKIKKTRQNVMILQRQTDSVRNLINGNIVDIAVSTDLNVNPTRQIGRTGIQRKQVDAQVNGALYTELVKNLELSKLTLRKETPLIQIIDTPMLPLEKKKLGRLTGAIIFGFVGGLLALIFFTLKKIFSAPDTTLSL